MFNDCKYLVKLIYSKTYNKEYLTYIFSKLRLISIFDQKAWTIAHGFDRFWLIVTPFKLFSIIFAGSKNMHFWPFLIKKHGL
jgi:hypothetical protein